MAWLTAPGPKPAALAWVVTVTRGTVWPRNVLARHVEAARART